MTFNQPIQTRYSETGQDGIIHHSSYVIYLEIARIQFLKKLGIDINDLEKRKVFCPVVDLSIKYLKPLNSLEEIIVHVGIDTLSKVRFSLSYEIKRDDKLTTKAQTSHCFLNEAFKPIPIPKEFINYFSK